MKPLVKPLIQCIRDITAVGQQPSISILADQPPKIIAFGLDGFSVFPAKLTGIVRVLPDPPQALDYDDETVQRDGTRGIILFNTSLFSQLESRAYGLQTLRFDFDNGVSFYGSLYYYNSYQHDKSHLYRGKNQAGFNPTDRDPSLLRNQM